MYYSVVVARRHNQQALLMIIWESALAAGLGGQNVSYPAFRAIVSEHSGYGEVALELFLRAGRDAGYWKLPDRRATFLGRKPSLVLIHSEKQREITRKGLPVDPLR